MFPKENKKTKLPWDQIDTVLLDMDGTILDRYFDDFFWEELVPERFASLKEISISEAKKELSAAFKGEEKTLNWTDIYYWSARLNLDIVSLKEEIQGKVRIHPGVEVFLNMLQRKPKTVILVTNAHPKTVQIKLGHTSILPYFQTVLCSSDVGMPKEEIGFWRDAEKVLGFNRLRTLLVDDNEDVLLAAHTFGIKHLLHKTGASSHVPNQPSEHFPSLEDFTSLIP